MHFTLLLPVSKYIPIEPCAANEPGRPTGARNLAEIQYSRGVSDFLTMLESARSAFDTESRYINARRERLDARVDLYMALGGGFDAEDSYIFNDEVDPELGVNEN